MLGKRLASGTEWHLANRVDTDWAGNQELRQEGKQSDGSQWLKSLHTNGDWLRGWDLSRVSRSAGL